jgi:phosphatidylserine decarboxylase
MPKLIQALTQQEQLNFLLTNRVPRRLLTQWMGWFSQIESPLLTKLSIKLWKLFADDLDLSESKETEFKSLRDCFIRELKPGVRTIDERENIVASPCDAIIGACGQIQGTQVFQAKAYPYELSDLIPDRLLQEKYRDGTFVTLRLKSSMYHRFHAPLDCEVKKVNYISGDTWNVNPIALERIEKLFCKNERAVLELHLNQQTGSITLVPVAAILVASMKFHCINETLDLKYKGPNIITCDAKYQKGDEMGYFQHGSTIIVFASKAFKLCEGLSTGDRISMGQALLVSSEPSL